MSTIDLTEEQKTARVVTETHNLQMFRRNPRMLRRIISIDETYLPFFMPRDPDQAHEWLLSGEPCPTQPRISLSDIADKVLLVLAVHQDQIVSWEYLEQGKKMTKERYIRFLNESLKPYIDRNEHFTDTDRPIILQDNAPSHNSIVVRNFNEQENWFIL